MVFHSKCIIYIINLHLLVRQLLLFVVLLKKFILFVTISILQTRIDLNRRLSLTHLVTHIIEAAHRLLSATSSQVIVIRQYVNALSHVVIWSQGRHVGILGIDQYQLLLLIVDVAHILCLTLHFILLLLGTLHLIYE